MVACPRLTSSVCALGAVAAGFGLVVGGHGTARAEVQIIGEPPSPHTSGGTPASPQLEPPEQHPLLTPASPSPSLDSPNTGETATPRPQSVPPDEQAPGSSPAPSTPKHAHNQIENLGKANVADHLNAEIQSRQIKVPNQAGLSVQIVSGSAVSIGELFSFQVSTKKPGYLILVDVDASGKLTQIYPSAVSLVEQGADENTNHLEPDNTAKLDNPQTAFELVASPPAGIAMVVAMLSDRPVQLVDLPDIPISLLGSAKAVDYLTKLANELRIAKNDTKDLEIAHWSFDVKFYSIR